jgi:lysyl-tRNA synthetase class 2
MDDTNSLIEQRKAKLAALRAKGIDPFKNKFSPTETCKQARDNYAEGRETAVAGRITAHREMGKSMFIDVRDQSGRIQIYAQKNALGDELWEIFKHLDLGDFVGVRGTMFTTKTGEISIKLGGAGVPSVGQASRLSQIEKEKSETAATAVLPPFVILSKALRPPPAKWHGLEDTEIRYRQRYLDLMASKPGTSRTGFEPGSSGDVLLLRSEIIREIRNFLHSRGFVEVETPMMQAIPGGAAAQPFKTHHNALGCDFYLRIALELYLKRLLVGGVDKVFEIGRNFRNEGLSRKHNPEFTMLEAYQAFGDYESMMELVESMVKDVAQKVLGTLVIEHDQSAELTRALNEAKHFVQEKALRAYQYHILKSPDAKAVNRFTERVQECLQKITAAEREIGQSPIQKIASEGKNALDFFAMDFVIQKGGPDISNSELGGVIRQFDAVRKALLTLTKQEPKIINLTPPWRRAKYKDLVREKAGADWFEISSAERRQRAHDLGAEITKDYADFEVTGAVFEKLIEPTLMNPVFVTHLPKELVPLAKLSPDDPSCVEVFECCINGQEIAPGYTEQNDPIEQRERLEHQAGGEQQKLDEDFLAALEHGMPPAGGIGIGIDRLCMMLLGQESIRDVILFPQLKPK